MEKSKLYAFLHPKAEVLEREVIVSDRFQNEDGTPVKFRIRAISQEENEALIEKSMRAVKSGKDTVKRLDRNEYSRRLVIAGTTFPDFTSSELCGEFGVIDPVLLVGKVLLSGEFAALMQAITKLSGFDVDTEQAAKNF